MLQRVLLNKAMILKLRPEILLPSKSFVLWVMKISSLVYTVTFQYAMNHNLTDNDELHHLSAANSYSCIHFHYIQSAELKTQFKS